jgi:hypothetical protein
LFQLRSVLIAIALLAPTWSVRQQGMSDPPRIRIEVNLPAFRIDVLADTTTVRSFPVAVGMRRYPTPLGDYSITEVQWNPWWRPPASPWAAKDTVTPPGPSNPMGKVKLPLGPLLYLHGTPLPSSIGKAASHSCIRMHNADAVTLARLLQSEAGAAITEAAVDSLLRWWRPTRRVPLGSPVAVRIVYRLVERRNDELVFHPDVYRLGRGTMESDALALLAAAGYDTNLVDRTLLQRAIRDGARTATAVRIPQLFVPVPVGGENPGALMPTPAVPSRVSRDHWQEHLYDAHFARACPPE